MHILNSIGWHRLYLVFSFEKKMIIINKCIIHSMSVTHILVFPSHKRQQYSVWERRFNHKPHSKLCHQRQL